MKTKQEKPLVSVIVTTFNREELLTETISSILAQTYKNFELIIVDNFSDYDFFTHIESFNDNRIAPFQNRNNGVIAVSRNFGIQKAKGEFIAFCDDDDLWMPYKLEEQIKHFDDGSIIGVGSESISFDDVGVRKKKQVKHDIILDFKEIIRGESVALSSLMIRNEGFLFDEVELFLACEDFDFQLKITLETAKKIKLLSKPFIYYRINSNNRSSGLNQTLNSLNVIEKYKRHLSIEMEKEIVGKIHYKIGKQELAFQLSRESRKHFLRSLLTWSLSYGRMGKCVLGIIISLVPEVFQKYLIKNIF